MYRYSDRGAIVRFGVAHAGPLAAVVVVARQAVPVQSLVELGTRAPAAGGGSKWIGHVVFMGR
jgi:hypothetical protein